MPPPSLNTNQLAIKPSAVQKLVIDAIRSCKNFNDKLSRESRACAWDLWMTAETDTDIVLKRSITGYYMRAQSDGIIRFTFDLTITPPINWARPICTDIGVTFGLYSYHTLNPFVLTFNPLLTSVAAGIFIESTGEYKFSTKGVAAGKDYYQFAVNEGDWIIMVANGTLWAVTDPETQDLIPAGPTFIFNDITCQYVDPADI